MAKCLFTLGSYPDPDLFQIPKQCLDVLFISHDRTRNCIQLCMKAASNVGLATGLVQIRVCGPRRRISPSSASAAPLGPFLTAGAHLRAGLGPRNDVQRKSQTTRDPGIAFAAEIMSWSRAASHSRKPGARRCCGALQRSAGCWRGASSQKSAV